MTPFLCQKFSCLLVTHPLIFSYALSTFCCCTKEFNFSLHSPILLHVKITRLFLFFSLGKQFIVNKIVFFLSYIFQPKPATIFRVLSSYEVSLTSSNIPIIFGTHHGYINKSQSSASQLIVESKRHLPHTSLVSWRRCFESRLHLNRSLTFYSFS